MKSLVDLKLESRFHFTKMGNLKHYLRLGMILLFLVNLCPGEETPKKVEESGAEDNKESRLGLLAMQLGIPPIAGYNDGDTVQIDAGPSPGDSVAASSASATATGYSIPDSPHGGNVVSPTQCQCVPMEQCPSYNGGGGGSYGGGQQGGNIPISPTPSGGNYGGQHGGNLPVSPPGGNYGGQHGGNLPISPGDNYGGQQGGKAPVDGGNNGGSYGAGGGIFPVPPTPGGSQGGIVIVGPEGQHGGNIPVVGGGGGGSYGSGPGGSQGGIVPIQGPGGSAGSGSAAGGPGYSGGESGGSLDAPNTDGAGLLDLRIVNRPPRPGGVQCLNGHIFCCDLGEPSKPSYPDQGDSGYGGYGTCGSRSFIDVPGKSLEYGDAKFGAYPWMAVILGKANNYVGAGALISPFYVLTAAHKIKSWKPGTAMKVRFGEWNAKEDDEPYKNKEIEVAEVITHPGFNPQNLQNDIALVRLAKAIDIKGYPHIKPVCLPQKGYDYTGKRCWVAGFGKDAFGAGKHSYIMKEVDLPIMDSNECEQRLRTTRLGKYFQLNRHSFLCAGGEEGKDACTGDGGSPLVCQTGNGGQFQVAGLVAWGIGCADYGIPGVYVNVPNYLDWIDHEIYKY